MNVWLIGQFSNVFIQQLMRHYDCIYVKRQAMLHTFETSILLATRLVYLDLSKKYLSCKYEFSQN